MARSSSVEYKKHLSSIFSLFVTDDMLRDNKEETVNSILLSEENMNEFWIPAITHVSYNPNPDRNWENLELLGDSYADPAFTRLFMTLYPGQTQLFYSETNNYYLSNEYISSITRDTLQLTKFIKIKDIREPTESMQADCFESFCGALVLSGDRHYLGFGLILIEYFIKYIFEGVDVDADRARTFGKSTTQLEQIAVRLGIPRISLTHYESNYIHTYEYFLTAEHIKGFNINLISKKIPSSNHLVIGKAIGRGKHLMKDQAADEAFSYLQSYGINTPWAINIKAKRDLLHPIVKKYATEAMPYVREDGYVSIMFREVDKSDTDDFIVVILLGVRQDGIQKSLEVIVVDRQVDTKHRGEVITESHRDVIITYLERKKREKK